MKNVFSMMLALVLISCSDETAMDGASRDPSLNGLKDTSGQGPQLQDLPPILESATFSKNYKQADWSPDYEIFETDLLISYVDRSVIETKYEVRIDWQDCESNLPYVFTSTAFDTELGLRGKSKVAVKMAFYWNDPAGAHHTQGCYGMLRLEPISPSNQKILGPSNPLFVGMPVYFL